jgi:hypothetical protein
MDLGTPIRWLSADAVRLPVAMMDPFAQRHPVAAR